MEQGIRQAFQNSVNGAVMMLSGLGTASQKGTFKRLQISGNDEIRPRKPVESHRGALPVTCRQLSCWLP
jgi:hypothetical protein